MTAPRVQRFSVDDPDLRDGLTDRLLAHRAVRGLAVRCDDRSIRAQHADKQRHVGLPNEDAIRLELGILGIDRAHERRKAQRADPIYDPF
jgi:hypothetical protein